MPPFLRPVAAAALHLVLLCLAAQPAFSTTPPARTPADTVQQDAAAMCRAACLTGAAAAPGGVSPKAAQACTIRCQAGQAHLARQNAQGTPEATGRGTAARSMPMVAGMPALQAARSPAFGVVYGGRSPSPAFGMVVGERDRLAAHREAERQCSARGPGCRVLAEFTAACGAAAQGIRRSPWALVITARPETYVVTSVAGGQGSTQMQAEADALAECRSRDPMAICRVVASACSGGE